MCCGAQMRARPKSVAHRGELAVAVRVVLADELGALIDGSIEAVAMKCGLQLEVVQVARAIGVEVVEGLHHICRNR
jgi:hypothetical protein